MVWVDDAGWFDGTVLLNSLGWFDGASSRTVGVVISSGSQQPRDSHKRVVWVAASSRSQVGKLNLSLGLVADLRWLRILKWSQRRWGEARKVQERDASWSCAWKCQTKKREVNRLGIFLFAQTLDYSECSTTLHNAFSIPIQAFALWGPFLGINHAYNTRVPILYRMWCTLLPNLCYTPLALICESLSNWQIYVSHKKGTRYGMASSNVRMDNPLVPLWARACLSLAIRLILSVVLEKRS